MKEGIIEVKDVKEAVEAERRIVTKQHIKDVKDIIVGITNMLIDNPKQFAIIDLKNIRDDLRETVKRWEDEIN